MLYPSIEMSEAGHCKVTSLFYRPVYPDETGDAFRTWAAQSVGREKRKVKTEKSIICC